MSGPGFIGLRDYLDRILWGDNLPKSECVILILISELKYLVHPKNQVNRGADIFLIPVQPHLITLQLIFPAYFHVEDIFGDVGDGHKQ